jgi:hypothetical protein
VTFCVFYMPEPADLPGEKWRRVGEAGHPRRPVWVAYLDEESLAEFAAEVGLVPAPPGAKNEAITEFAVRDAAPSAHVLLVAPANPARPIRSTTLCVSPPLPPVRTLWMNDQTTPSNPVTA